MCTWARRRDDPRTPNCVPDATNGSRWPRMMFWGQPARLSRESVNVRPRLPAGHARKCPTEVPLFCILPSAPTVNDTGRIEIRLRSATRGRFSARARPDRRGSFFSFLFLFLRSFVLFKLYLVARFLSQVPVFARPYSLRYSLAQVCLLAKNESCAEGVSKRYRSSRESSRVVRGQIYH